MCHQALPSDAPSDAPSGVERRQVQELPPLRLQITEHQLREVRCPSCGATRAAAAPTDVSALRQAGPRVGARAAALVQQQVVPSARVRERLADACGTARSLSPRVNRVRLGANRLHGGAEESKAALRQAPVLCTTTRDGTACGAWRRRMVRGGRGRM
jgi:hypothetical protein